MQEQCPASVDEGKGPSTAYGLAISLPGGWEQAAGPAGGRMVALSRGTHNARSGKLEGWPAVGWWSSGGKERLAASLRKHDVGGVSGGLRQAKAGRRIGRQEKACSSPGRQGTRGSEEVPYRYGMCGCESDSGRERGGHGEETPTKGPKIDDVRAYFFSYSFSLSAYLLFLGVVGQVLLPCRGSRR